MRVRRRRISLLLLLTLSLPFSAAVADASRAKPGSVEQLGEPAVPKAGDASTASKTLASPPVPKPGDPNNKDAPVDGLDGRPKIGPFVDKKKPIAVVEDLTVGGKPISQDLVKGGKDKLDGWLVPEPDSVMEDRPHDDATKKGPTGLEGGISEKDRERKEKEEKGEAPEPKVPARYPEKADAGSSPGDYIDPKKYGNKDKEKEKQKEEDAKKDTEGKFKPLEVRVALCFLLLIFFPPPIYRPRSMVINIFDRSPRISQASLTTFPIPLPPASPTLRTRRSPQQTPSPMTTSPLLASTITQTTRKKKESTVPSMQLGCPSP